MNDTRITRAQRDAVAKLDLPFDLADSDIARQFYSDGSQRPRDTTDPMARARHLARTAMNEAAKQLPQAA